MGGIFYFRDIENKPVLSLEWDMKLLWPHCEALIAFLRSYMRIPLTPVTPSGSVTSTGTARRFHILRAAIGKALTIM